MKKYIFMTSFFVTIIFSLLANKASALNMEYGIGSTWFTNSHTIDSHLHSIVKWRDMDAASANAYVKYTPTSKFYLKLAGEYGWIYNGEATDDDMQNSKEHADDFAGAVNFSVTKKLRGYDYNLVLTGGYEVLNIKNNKINAVLGYKHSLVKMKPKGAWHVNIVYLVDDYTQNAGFLTEWDHETQHAELTSTGFLAGAEYVREFDEKNSFFVEMLAFLPVHTETVTSYWTRQSADGSWESKFRQKNVAVGLDAKAGTNLNITSNFNLTLYTFFNYLYVRKPLEKRIPHEVPWIIRTDQTANYMSYSKIGVGLNFYYK